MKEAMIELFYRSGGLIARAGLVHRWASESYFIMYHRILSDRHALLDQTGIATSVSHFERHLQYLKKHCDVVSISDWLKVFQSGELSSRITTRPLVVVTFDDGYRDNIQAALPLLSKYQLPATFYITTRFADGDRRMWWYDLDYLTRTQNEVSFDWDGRQIKLPCGTNSERKVTYSFLRELIVGCSSERQESLISTLFTGHQLPAPPETLSWSELRQMALDPLVTIGAHTVSHPVLSQLTAENVKEELIRSRQRLEEQLQIPIDHFAYPFGSRAEADEREFAIARELGFKTAVTTNSSRLTASTSLWALPRVAIKRRTTSQHLAVKLTGWNNFPLWNGIQV